MESTMNILILDDDKWVGQSLTTLFSLDGHSVRHIADPKEVHDFGTRNLDLLVCDYQFGEVTASFVIQLPGFEDIADRILISGHLRNELPDEVVDRFSSVVHKSDFSALRACVEGLKTRRRVI